MGGAEDLARSTQVAFDFGAGTIESWRGVPIGTVSLGRRPGHAFASDTGYFDRDGKPFMFTRSGLGTWNPTIVLDAQRALVGEITLKRCRVGGVEVARTRRVSEQGYLTQTIIGETLATCHLLPSPSGWRTKHVWRLRIEPGVVGGPLRQLVMAIPRLCLESYYAD